eukprot:COSAG02_NODE_44697_length_364_cov_0.513208_1_plen_75_part_01
MRKFEIELSHFETRKSSGEHSGGVPGVPAKCGGGAIIFIYAKVKMADEAEVQGVGIDELLDFVREVADGQRGWKN